MLVDADTAPVRLKLALEALATVGLADVELTSGYGGEVSDPGVAVLVLLILDGLGVKCQVIMLELDPRATVELAVG